MRDEQRSIVRTRVSAGHAAVVVLAVGALAASLMPEIALSPLGPYLNVSRTPAKSAQAAVFLLRSAALLLTVLALTWPLIARRVGRVLTWIAELPAGSFWVLILGSVVITRGLVAATFTTYPISDAGWYHEAAQSLSRGEGLRVGGQLTAYRFPGYPFLLSLTYRVFHPSIEMAWIWGLASTALLIGLTHFLAASLHDRATARLAALGLALYPAAILRTGVAMSDLPFVAGLVLLAAVVLRKDSHRLGWVLLTGALLVGLTLIRGPALGLVLVVPAIWLLDRRSGKGVLVGVLALLAVVAAGLAPWAVRNHTVFGRAVLSTNVGLNFFIGNYKGASGGYLASERPVPEVPRFLNAADQDLVLLRLTITHLAENPLQLIKLLPEKLFHFYALETNAVTLVFQGNDQVPLGVKYALYGVSQASYLLVLVLFLWRAAGLLLRDNRPRGRQWAGWLLIGYFTLVTLVFFGHDRYRLAILPFMLIEASLVLSRSARKPVTETVVGSEVEPSE